MNNTLGVVLDTYPYIKTIVFLKPCINAELLGEVPWPFVRKTWGDHHKSNIFQTAVDLLLVFPHESIPPMCRFWHAVMQILTAENIELYILLPTVPMLVRSSTDFHMYPALFCRRRIYLLQSLK